MNTFSFRAEFQHDVNRFSEVCLDAGIFISMQIYPDEIIPDVVVDLKTDATLSQLRDVMRKIVDSHVMLQTLRECSYLENTMERDYHLM